MNAALTEFFGVSVTEASNIPTKSSNTSNSGNIPVDLKAIPAEVISNIPTESAAVKVLPHLAPSLSEDEVESLRQELDAVRIENQRLQSMLGNSEGEVEKLSQQLEEVRSQLETVQANPPATPVAEFKLPEPASVLNLLKGKRKKSKTELGDIEVLWEILGDS